MTNPPPSHREESGVWESMQDTMQQVEEALEVLSTRHEGHDPLHVPRLVVYFVQQGLKWVYLVLGFAYLGMTALAAYVNPLEGVKYVGGTAYRVGGEVIGSPIIAAAFFGIALFLFHQFRALHRKERPTDD